MEDQNIIPTQTDQPPKKKPAFDPNKSFQPVQEKGKPSFDEGKPYQELKKKDGAGSVYPSASSPNQAQTAPPVSTSDSEVSKKQLTTNYKNNSLTPEDIHTITTGAADLKEWKGLTPEQLSQSINNKGKNLSKWSNEPSDGYISSLVNQQKDISKKIEELTTRQSMVGDVPNYERELKNLKDQEAYLRTDLQKNYDVRKGKIVPELLDDLKKKVEVGNWADAYDKPDKEILGIKIQSPLQWNPESHKLTPKSVEWVAKNVDDAMNIKGDNVVNAQVSGDVGKKKRTYQDLTQSVVDYLNTVPIQKEQEKFTEKFAKDNPHFKEAINANKQINEYFSKGNVDAVKARVNTERDKELIKTGQKYFGPGGVFPTNQEFIGIQHKYAQLVADGKMTETVAKKQIQEEIKQNPVLKKENENMQDEVKKIHEKTQNDFKNYMISGLRKGTPSLNIYKDGSVGVTGLSEDQYKSMMDGYEKGLYDVAKKIGGEQVASTMKQANDKAKSVGAFWGSVGSSINELTSAFSKFMFNKTQWGQKNVQYHEAQEIASPQISQSQVAAAWNWKGIESLKDPSFWLSKTGSMVPVIAGTAAIGLATDGAGLPEYVGWLANAGIFTAQSGLSTYSQMLNTRDAQGNLLTEADASHYMANQMEKDFLPNLLMMAVTSGTILKAKNIAKPSLLGTAGRGVAGAAMAQPFFTWQGYNDYATSQEAQGKPTDFWDYMQSKDFKDNLINGMVVGSGLSLLHAPGTYMKSVDNWTKMVHTSEGEFKNLIPQNYALGQEMAGNGNYLRDALKLHVFNTDPEGLNEEGKRNLADLKNTLLYSVNLDKNIRTGNLDPKNIKDLYQAHNLALADQHDYLSDQASKEGNKSLSDIYKDKAKDYREQAKAASNGEAKYHYLINGEGHPVFMSDKSFKKLEQEGTIAKWMKDGTIKDVVKSDDPEFAQRYKDFVQAKDEATVEGTDIDTHAKALIEQNKDKLGVYYGVAKENHELFYKNLSDQVFGRNADGTISLRPDAEIEARTQFGDDIVDVAKMMYPKTEESVAAKEPAIQSAIIKVGNVMYEGENNSEAISKAEADGKDVSKIDREKDGLFKVSDGRIITREEAKNEFGADHSHELITPEYKPNIRDDYFSQADFFTPEEKEKFQTLDDARKDKMIDEKRAQLKASPEDNIPVSEMMDKQVTYKGKRGMLSQDGQIVVFKEEGGKKEYELGNVDKLSGKSAKELGIGTEKSIVDADEQGQFTVRGKKYINPFEERGQDPTDAILYDKEGNVVNVRMKTPEGERRTFTGPVAEDLAYQIHLKEISKNNEQPALEEFINSDEPTRKEIEDAGLATSSEGKATEDTEKVPGISIEKIEPISSPKTESNEKAKEAEGRKDVLKEGEGTETKSDGKDKPPPPPKPPVPKVRVPAESPKEEFTSVRKEKNAEIKGAKELFERQKVIKWTETYDKALSNVQAMFPDKNLYDAMKSRIGQFTAMLDSGTIFNPTSEDIAVFGVFKNETRRRMLEIQGWDSSDPIQGVAAAAEFKVLQKELFNVARVTNPEGEAGRAFYMLQSEVGQDPDEGLKLRRMQYSADRGGKKLTPEDMEWTADQWEEEKALMQKEQELKQKGMQEKFDKEIGKLKAEYDKKLKDAGAEKKPTSTKEKREKLLKEKGAELAAKIRSGKLKGTYATFPGVPQAINVVLEGIAKLVEGGYSLAQAIDEYVQANKIKNKDQFTNDLFTVFNKQEKQEESYDKIQKLAAASGASDVTTEMVGKKLIQDYVDSHVGLHEPKDVLDIAHAELKNVLPDLEKDRLVEAYLKQGDFKQPTKKELESGFKQSQRNFDRLVKLEKDINDLNEKSSLYKQTNNKPSPYDKEVEAKEKEKKNIMDSMGIKTSSEDKYTKSTYDQRAKDHNTRLSDIGSAIDDKIAAGDLSEKSEKALIKLKNQLDAAGIKIDPTSALSQEKTLQGGLEILKSIKSEFQRTAMDDATKLGDVNRSLQKAIDKFSSDKDESQQNAKLQRAKDQAKRDSEKYFQKISNGEYEDKVVNPLTKTDAELIKLQRDRDAIGKIYQDKRREFEKANKTGWRRFFDFARAAMVDYMIGGFFTYAKVAGSALLRPNLEAATKLTFGKGFEALPFETTKAISEKAKEGGESSDIKSIQKGYETYFRQYSQEQLEGRYKKANDKYENSSQAFIDAQKELDRSKYANGKDSDEYRKAEVDFSKAKNQRNDALVDAIGNSVYQYIAGSSVKEAMEVLLHRSTQMERQFGDFDREGWEKFKSTDNGKAKIATAMDNVGYVMNFVGRTHAALKNFSSRFSFATGFMARLDYAVKNDIDISQPDKILEIAHASYLDWERGKYQESNWVTDTWNKAVRGVEKASPELAYLMRADVAITRVPVNMLREGVMEYTLGAFRGSVMAAREYYKAKGIVLQDGYTPDNEAQFKQELREQLNKMDPEKAATIVRAFRKGGFGLGLYALGLLGHAAFGGWAHKGQTAEDAKKTKREVETGVPELKTSEIKIGDWKMPEFAAKIVEHTPAFYPLGFGLGLSKVYENNIIDGRSTPASATNAAMAQINHVIGSIPQAELVTFLTANTLGRLKPSGQWDDVDQEGNPMKRHAFNASDYFNYLPGYGTKKDILSETYYKQAVAAQKSYRQQITDVETNTSLSKQDKKEQREALLKELNETIDSIYEQNKENPQ